jgi:hypothetical protein
MGCNVLFYGLHQDHAQETNDIVVHQPNTGTFPNVFVETLCTDFSNHALAGEDAWSLITTEGLNVRCTTSVSDWNDGLRAYQPDFCAFESDISGLESVSQIIGERVTFFIDVQPPNPIFISPQTEVACQMRSDLGGAAVHQPPDCVEWHIMMAFPDGYPREVIASRFYINGNIVNVNGKPPFDVLTWEISTHIEPGEYVIQAEVEDSLGLSARTRLPP